MKIELKQNSFAWYAHRKKFINSSEIGTIMNLNPYETPEDLIKKKLFPSEFVMNEAMEHGRKTEPKANLFFSCKMKRNYEPAVFTHDIFSASLDGYHEPTKTMLEIKCPFQRKSTSWNEFFTDKIIPPYYFAQIQCGLYCSETQKAYFFVYFTDNENYTSEVLLDLSFIEKMKKSVQQYKELFAHYQERIKIEES